MFINLTKKEYDLLSNKDRMKNIIYIIDDVENLEETTTFKRTNCPNCNAPISQHICPYCGTWND